MKGLLVFCLAILFCNFSIGQLSKKEISVGGNLGYGSTRNKNEDPFGSRSTYTSYNIAPNVFMGLSGNWMLGFGTRYAHGKQSSAGANSSQSITSYIYEVSLLARKFHPFNKQFGIFGQAGPNIGFGTQKVKSSQTTNFNTDLKFYSASVSPGLYFKPSKKFIVEAIFGEVIYTHSVTKPQAGFTSISDGFDFKLTEALSIGVKFVLQ